MKRRRFSWSVVLTVAVVAGASCGAAQPAGAGAVPGPVNTPGPPPLPLPFKLVNQTTNLCATPVDGSVALNVTAVQYLCDADPARLWETLVRGDGYQEVYNESTGLCLSPAGGSTAAGAVIVQYRCDNDPARGWTVVHDNDRGNRIVNEHSGLCLAVRDGVPGGALVQHPCGTDDWWAFSGGEQLRNVSSQLEIDLPYPGGPNAAAYQWDWGSFFHIALDTTGTYTLQQTFNRLCLSPAGGSTAANAAIVEYSCDDDPARHWTITTGPLGTYIIRNVGSGMCMSPAGGASTPGATLVQYYCDGDPSRLWTFVEDQHPGIG